MSIPARTQYTWQLRTRTLALGAQTRVMGVVNVTPDSFSDGGRFRTPQDAIDHGLRLLDEGADILDIGGESTRPGSPAATTDALSADEEQHRVVPVIRGILRAAPHALLSVDTYRAETARVAVQAGAEIVNDVSGGLWDSTMLPTCAALRCGVVVMHTRGLPSAWALQPSLLQDEVVPEVFRGLRERVAAALAAGIARQHLVADPGFGFGKRGAENWALLAGFALLRVLDLPLLAGLSRKGFLAGALAARGLGATPTLPQRDALTHSADAMALQAGAHLVRVHDVAGAVCSAAVVDAALAER